MLFCFTPVPGWCFCQGWVATGVPSVFCSVFSISPSFPLTQSLLEGSALRVGEGEGGRGGVRPLISARAAPSRSSLELVVHFVPARGAGLGFVFLRTSFSFRLAGDRSSCSRPSPPWASPPSLHLPGDGRGGRGRTFFPLYCVFLCLHMYTVFSSLLCVFLFTYVYSVPPASGHAFLHMCIGTACVFTSRGTFGNVGLALRPRLLPRAR